MANKELDPNQNSEAVEESEFFKNRAQAFAWLEAEGHAVSRGKFYADCNAGDPPVREDKQISRFRVLQYAQRIGQSNVRSDGSLSEDALRRSGAETRKIVAGAEREEMKRDNEKRELDKKWIYRDEAELEKCVFAALTRDKIAHRVIQALPAIIHSCGGQLALLPSTQPHVDQAISDGCNDIANSGDIDVEIDGDEFGDEFSDEVGE